MGAAADTTSGEALPKLPRLEDVQELIFGLTGQNVVLSRGGKIRSTQGGTVAVYVDDHDELKAFAISDVAFAAYCGAALAMIPPRTAHQAVIDHKLDQNLWDNYREVVNVAASLFCQTGPHVRLQEVYELSRDMPEPVMQALRRPSSRLMMRAEIANFGQGQLALAVA